MLSYIITQAFKIFYQFKTVGYIKIIPKNFSKIKEILACSGTKFITQLFITTSIELSLIDKFYISPILNLTFLYLTTPHLFCLNL